MSRAMSPARLALLTLAGSLLPLASPAAAQTAAPARMVVQAPPANRAVVYGRAIDSTGRPAMGVHIELVGTRVAVVTDDDGLFVIRDLKPGLYVATAKRIGYEARVFDLSVAGGEVLQVGLELVRQPQMLEVVRVDGVAFKPDRLAYTTKFDEFYFRRQRESGTFFDRTDLAASGARDVYDLLRQVPGMRILTSGWDRTVRMAACPSPWVYFDGVKTAHGLHGINDMRLDDVEAIEVYRSASSMPVAAKGGCGAIFFWFRSTAR